MMVFFIGSGGAVQHRAGSVLHPVSSVPLRSVRKGKMRNIKGSVREVIISVQHEAVSV
ncbi:MULTISPECIES: hypothetical protein [Sutcliffiella]|uniref:hypothetical protein n=1 Tax=Sutcliffiella TaxID=2837511 RepID=UPI0012EE6DC7|nr:MULTISPECIES: hypothetical protein [Sutcliffiella]MED4018248.1 hypothetical protein [Sutcliffiella cohnii]WBL15522.1 hypothetical protein O1A01_02400 [Sutcliffiella sp. NC1]